MWDLVKHSEKHLLNTSQIEVRREAQCRPMLQQDYNQSPNTDCVKPFINCSKILSAPVSILGYKSDTMWQLVWIFLFFFSFLQGWRKCIQQQNFLHIFLCTVNIQSMDRGIYIQFGTHGLNQQKDFITFKEECRLASPHIRVWALNFKPLDNKKQTNEQKYKGKSK